MTRVLIQAVPWDQQRVRNVRSLCERTGAEVVWDSERSGYRTYLRLLEAAGDDPAVMVEDDAHLCSDWDTRLAGVLEQHPDDVVQLWSNYPGDLIRGSRWIDWSEYYGTVGMYYPAGVARAVREHAAFRHRKTWERRFDEILADWARVHRRKIWVEVPSLVQHLPFTSVDAPTRPRNRQSRTFEEAP